MEPIAVGSLKAFASPPSISLRARCERRPANPSGGSWRVGEFPNSSLWKFVDRLKKWQDLVKAVRLRYLYDTAGIV